MNFITKTISLLLLTTIITACVGGPGDRQPEAVEQAYKALGSGVAHYNKSNYSLARGHFVSALNLFRSVDHREGIASSCLNIAKVHLETKEPDLANDYLKRADKIITESHIDGLSNHLAITKSSIAITNHDYQSAKQILDPLIANNKDKAIGFAALQNRIRVALAENNLDEAKALNNQFMQSLVNSGQTNSTYQARFHRFQARLDYDMAGKTRHFDSALKLYRQHAHRPGIASSLHEWGDALLLSNQSARAKEKLLRALFIRQSIEDRMGSRKILSSLSAAGMTTKSENWIKKLNANNFDQWEEFIAAFNEYPSAD